ncbi:hypothetical protein LTR53_015545 [Teratosphaeriaceae sp. CCFEE 6253]|nr:hypothetical protein LTR53_015545 [Teratosphaeriaceae sp. CCFEE 6253]
MAEVATMPSTNGYAPHQGYGSIEQQGGSHGYSSGTPASAQSMYSQVPATAELGSATSSQSDIPKDEVGWYFVEQYYTTLSRSPEKLYLFYNKRSQFVSGPETDKVPVCVGQRAINDRIKELDFHDCKVRVTNVDSQASDANIVIQVIGEISNKGQPHKKFTQTFVLATQTNGYFVLNDIFRYLIEEEEEQAEPEIVTEPEQEAKENVPIAETAKEEPAETPEETIKEEVASSEDPLTVEEDAPEPEKEVEEKSEKEEEPPAATTNGDHEAEQAEAEVEPLAETAAAVEESKPEEAAEPELSQPSTKEAEAEPEKEKSPASSPAATPAAAEAPAQPAAPPKPSAPKTWASLAASANRVATPATPQPSAQPPAQPRQSTPAAKPQPAPQSAPTPPAPTASGTAPAAPAPPVNESTSSPASDEWVAVQGHNRQQSRQQQGQQVEQGQNRGYIKNVTEGVEFSELESHLKQFGELLYFDIARQKTCAFVDFRTPEQYQAAVAANPHNVGSEKLYVEVRRVRPGTVPYIPRGGPYGRGGGRGGPSQGSPRGDFGGRGRGGYAPRGARGGPGGAPRGRGGAPQAE